MKMYKSGIFALAACMAVGMFAGCSKKTANDTANKDATKVETKDNKNTSKDAAKEPAKDAAKEPAKDNSQLVGKLAIVEDESLDKVDSLKPADAKEVQKPSDLKKGELVVVKSVEGDLAYVEVLRPAEKADEKCVGYIPVANLKTDVSEADIKDNAKVAVIKADGVKTYDKKDGKENNIQLKQNQLVNIVSMDNDWVQVKQSGQDFWLKASDLGFDLSDYAKAQAGVHYDFEKPFTK